MTSTLQGKKLIFEGKSFQNAAIAAMRSGCEECLLITSEYKPDPVDTRMKILSPTNWRPDPAEFRDQIQRAADQFDPARQAIVVTTAHTSAAVRNPWR